MFTLLACSNLYDTQQRICNMTIQRTISRSVATTQCHTKQATTFQLQCPTSRILFGTIVYQKTVLQAPFMAENTQHVGVRSHDANRVDNITNVKWCRISEAVASWPYESRNETMSYGNLTLLHHSRSPPGSRAEHCPLQA